MNRSLFVCVAATLLAACGSLPFEPLPQASLQCVRAPVEGVRVSFLGTATVLIDDGENALLVDGFFSRPPLSEVLWAPLRSDPARVTAALERAGVCRLDAVLVAHAHYDHALDAPLVARMTGAVLVGGASVGRIGSASGLRDEEIDIVAPPASRRFGRFEVQALASAHAPRPMFSGPVGESFAVPARVWEYREGENLGFHIRHPQGSVIVHASANFVPGMYEANPADVVLLGVGLLGRQDEGFVREYWRQVVEVSGARVVVPIHWDDFMRPLDAPLPLSPYDPVQRALDRVDELARGAGIMLQQLDAFESLHLPLQLVSPR